MRLINLLIITSLFSCNSLTTEQNLIKKSLGKTIEIGIFERVWHGESEIPLNEFRSKHPFISIVYLEDGCSPCYPRFIDWQKRIDSLDTGVDYEVLYIILGSSYERFLDNLFEYEPSYELPNIQPYIIMDPDYRFLDKNIEIDRDILNRSILIGPDNKIKLIGAPFASPQMTDLFYKIINREVK